MPADQKLGPWGEDIAAAFLESLGYEIAERNYRCEQGEVDIIAVDGDEIVFVEVKTRRHDDTGSPLEAITRRKQTQIARTALNWALENKRDEFPMRFDAIGIEPDESGAPEIDHVIDAFVIDG